MKKRALTMWMSNNPILHFDNLISLAKGRIPGQVIIQYTDRCNAKYYRACDYYDGRKAPDYRKLKREL